MSAPQPNTLSDFLNIVDSLRRRLGPSIYDPASSPKHWRAGYSCRVFFPHTGCLYRIDYDGRVWQSCEILADGNVSPDSRFADLICGATRDADGSLVRTPDKEAVS